MTDRLTNIVLGLQRMMEETHIRGKDIRHAQQQEDAAHLAYLNELVAIVQRVHSGLIDDIREFTPPENVVPYQLNQAQAAKASAIKEQQEAMPKFLQQGPRKAAE